MVLPTGSIHQTTTWLTSEQAEKNWLARGIVDCVQLIYAWGPRKAMFTREQIVIAWDRLVSQQWISP
jgi:hypothetical protein